MSKLPIARTIRKELYEILKSACHDDESYHRERLRAAYYFRLIIKLLEKEAEQE